MSRLQTPEGLVRLPREGDLSSGDKTGRSASVAAKG